MREDASKAATEDSTVGLLKVGDDIASLRAVTPPLIHLGGYRVRSRPPRLIRAAAIAPVASKPMRVRGSLTALFAGALSLAVLTARRWPHRCSRFNGCHQPCSPSSALQCARCGRHVGGRERREAAGHEPRTYRKGTAAGRDRRRHRGGQPARAATAARREHEAYFQKHHRCRDGHPAQGLLNQTTPRQSSHPSK